MLIRKKSLLLNLVLLLTLGSCAKTSSRYREGDNSGQGTALTVEEEKKLTQEALPQMKKEFPAVSNQQLQSYIERIGNKIVAANKLRGNPYTYTFTVVDVTNVNAFAMPAGSVFMTVPIIAMADSEAELAGVLGHEIGHVTARHTAERMYQEKQQKGKSYLLGGVGGLLGGAAGFFLGKKLCDDGDTACKAKATVIGAGAGVAGGVFIHKYSFMKNSQEDELESDRVGFRYAVNAGYDKNKVGDFYGKLLAMEQASKSGQNAFMSSLSDAMSTHPPSKERVEQASEMQQLVTTNGGVSVTNEFQQMKKIAQEILSDTQKRESKK